MRRWRDLRDATFSKEKQGEQDAKVRELLKDMNGCICTAERQCMKHGGVEVQRTHVLKRGGR